MNLNKYSSYNMCLDAVSHNLLQMNVLNNSKVYKQLSSSNYIKMDSRVGCRLYIRDMYVNFQKNVTLKSKKVFCLMKRLVKTNLGVYSHTFIYRCEIFMKNFHISCKS